MLLKTPGHDQVVLLPQVSGGVDGWEWTKAHNTATPPGQACGQRESKNQGSGFPFKGIYPVTQGSSAGPWALKVYSTLPPNSIFNTCAEVGILEDTSATCGRCMFSKFSILDFHCYWTLKSNSNACGKWLELHLMSISYMVVTTEMKDRNHFASGNMILFLRKETQRLCPRGPVLQQKGRAEDIGGPSSVYECTAAVCYPALSSAPRNSLYTPLCLPKTQFSVSLLVITK